MSKNKRDDENDMFSAEAREGISSVEDLSDEQLDWMVKGTQLGPKTVKKWNPNNNKKMDQRDWSGDRYIDTGSIDYDYYDGNMRTGRGPTNDLNNIWGGISPKDQEVNRQSQLWGDTADAIGYKNLDSSNDIADMFMRLKDERLNRRLEGLETQQEELVEDIPDINTTPTDLSPEDQAAIDSARAYEQALPYYGTRIFGSEEERDALAQMLEPEDYYSENASDRQKQALRFDTFNSQVYADEFKNEVANELSPKGRKSAMRPS